MGNSDIFEAQACAMQKVDPLPLKLGRVSQCTVMPSGYPPLNVNIISITLRLYVTQIFIRICRYMYVCSVCRIYCVL